MAGTLYVVGTPIGNLSDLTFRAETTLKVVNLIAAEDTRTSKKLLRHYNIDTPLIAYHDNNEINQARNLVNKLNSGDSRLSNFFVFTAKVLLLVGANKINPLSLSSTLLVTL